MAPWFKRCCLSLVTVSLLFTVSSTALAQFEVIRDPGTQRVVALKTSTLPVTAAPSSVKNTSSAELLHREAADRFISENLGAIGLSDPSSELDAIPSATDELGMSHIRYEQKHMGVPVLGGEMVLHVNPAGEVTFVTMGLADGLPSSVIPSISGTSASRIARAQAAIDAGRNTKLLALPARLYVLPLGMIQNAPGSDTFLAWEIKLWDPEQRGGFSTNYYINASNGAVALKLSNKEQLNRSAYDCAGGTCRLDYYNSTYNYYFGRSESAPARGPSPITFYLNTTTPSSDVDNLHTLLDSVHTFVSSSFAIDGANNQGGSSTGLSPNDQSRGFAHWNGSICPNGAEFEHLYGDLHFCLQMTAPDTVGHEYAHAVVFHSYHDSFGNPVGTIYSGQSGALNEGHSDFFGELFEYYNSDPHTTDWKSGTNSAWTVLFNLAYPPDAGYRTTPGGTVIPYPYRWYSPGVYCGTAYDNGGVHVNGSIISHMFYRMAVGGGENGCYVQPIGTEAAKQIFYRAFRMNYLSRTATFAQAYSAFQQSCAELYPAATCDQVRTALQAAEINQGGLCSAVPEAAPACAAMAVTSWQTLRPDRFSGELVQTTDFAPGETMTVRGCGNTPNRLITLSLRRHFITLPSAFAVGSVWSSQLRTSPPFGTTFIVSATTGADGCFETAFPTLEQELRNGVLQTNYDIGVDGDNDGLWEPWADSMLQNVTIAPPVDGDGICRDSGQYASTSEDCMNAPLDCGCAAGQRCVDTSPGDVTDYQCRQIPPACFLAGTRITMSDGSSRPIEEVKVGDLVKSFDEKTGKFAEGHVIGLRRDSTPEYVLVNGTTKVTANHRFYIPPSGKAGIVNTSLTSDVSPAMLAGGEWIEIGKLRPGALLLDQRGKLVEVKSIERIKEPAPVFNFQVAPYPTYVANGIVVHNRKVLQMMQALGDGQEQR